MTMLTSFFLFVFSCPDYQAEFYYIESGLLELEILTFPEEKGILLRQNYTIFNIVSKLSL